MQTGILALQGDFEAHGEILKNLGEQFIYVRKPQHLTSIQRLIIPGGESTTLLNFLSETDFLSALRNFGESGFPIMGTCAGAILLAKEILNPTQTSLGLVDVTIERNAYGRQLSSHVGQGEWLPTQSKLEMMFIRAPKIVRVGNDVSVLALSEGAPVCVAQKNILIATFHPEIVKDCTLHQYFLGVV